MKNFIEYMFYSILEMNQGEEGLPIYFSDQLREIINQIDEDGDDEIARRLLWEEGKNSKRIYVDIDKDSIDKVSFLMSNKAEEILGRTDKLKYLKPDEYDKVWKASQRGTMKINRFINGLFNNEYETKKITPEQREINKEKGIKTPSQHLEEFVNKFKSIREPGEFQLVKGEEISHWYNEDQYENDDGTLGSSCMMYQDCQFFFGIYESNPKHINLLIMKSKSNPDEIIGRALIWNLDTPSGRTFMDRVYTSWDYDVENFKKYAKDRGWLYKDRQNSTPGESIVDTQNGTISKITMVCKVYQDSPFDRMDSYDEETYPYLDTMKYYAPDIKTITNNEDVVSDHRHYELEGTEGSDHEMRNLLSIEEMRERYKDDIIDDIIYYVVDMYPTRFWDYIDDDEYIKSHIKSEIEYYNEDFIYTFTDTDELIELIKSNLYPKQVLPKNIDDMAISELHDLVDELNLRGEISKEYVEDRYKDYSAKDVYDELYGGSITRESFEQFENYFDDDGFATYVSDREDEDHLRDKYRDG